MLTWNEAVNEAMQPTELDFKLGGKRGVFGTGESIIGENGEITDFKVVRERAVRAYCAAHEGEEVTVHYADPKSVDQRSRAVWYSVGKLTCQIVSVPTFVAEGRIGNYWGLVVGDKIVPVSGITSIRTADDRSVVTL